MTVAIGLAAVAIAAAIFWLGRRDLAHPAVAFGLAWFICVAITQLDLTTFVQPWSGSFALLVFGGGLAFVAAATIAAGTAPARGTVAPRRSDYDPGRILLAALILIASGFLGRWLESRILGGVPLLSGNIDALRSNAYGNGNVAIPSYVTFLSNGFYLGGWCLLAYLWLRWRELSRLATAAVSGGVVLAAVGALAGGSRNVFLYAMAVPLVAVYASTQRLPRRAIGSIAVAVALLLVVFSGVYIVRSGGNADTGQPRILRPLVPLYVATAYPFEAERRYVLAMPGKFSPTRGGATLASLPDAAFPHGKPPLGNMIGTLTHTSPKAPNWTVASYQGRIIADFGATAVLPFSILLGLLLGAGYRACRGRRGLLALAAVGIIAYYAAFMTYDNLLSFSLGVFYDLVVVACVAAFAGGLTVRGRLRRPGNAGVRTVVP